MNTNMNALKRKNYKLKVIGIQNLKIQNFK